MQVKKYQGVAGENRSLQVCSRKTGFKKRWFQLLSELKCCFGLGFLMQGGAQIGGFEGQSADRLAELPSMGVRREMIHTRTHRELRPAIFYCFEMHACRRRGGFA
jgi:hypothetical protein